MRHHPVGPWLLAAAIVVSSPALAGEASVESKVAPWLRGRLERVTQDEFLVLLDSPSRPPVDAALAPADLHAALVKSARESQAGVLSELKGRGVEARSFYLVNAVLVRRGDAALARALAARPEVARIVGNPRVRGPQAAKQDSGAASPETLGWNITTVRADAVWSTYGTHGEGIVVASADTGVDWGHVELIDQYRGYDTSTGSYDHSYAWHDAFGVYDYPEADGDHGTETTGLMVAINGIGVAPAAKWIACRNMDAGAGTPASYIDCMEWTLAPYPPGGDPATDGRPDLAPHIVNNSWACPTSEGCDAHTLDEALARVRQAGIFMTASAMNTGPNCSTVDSTPAISADAFTVGAMDQYGELTTFSSRGPVTVDGSGRMKPDLVAPGRMVYTTAPSQTHALPSGTSMAAPHVAAGVALLWSSRPALRGLVGLTSCILERSASPTLKDFVPQACGGIDPSVVPNNSIGYGILDLYAAFGLSSADADPAPDVCDCAPADPGAYGMPVEVTQLRVDEGGAIAWDIQGPDTGTGTRYDVLRGNLAALRADQGTGGAGCLARDLGVAAAGDPDDAASGTGVYYLARAGNACGRSTWGAARQSTACD